MTFPKECIILLLETEIKGEHKMRKQLRNEIKNNNNLSSYTVDCIETALEQDWRTTDGRIKSFNELLNAEECGMMNNQYSHHFLRA